MAQPLSRTPAAPSSELHPLDNVIWRALTTRQAHFAEAYGTAARFTPEVSSLAAFEGGADEGYESLRVLVPPQEIIRLFLEFPCEDRPGWVHVGGARLRQMVWSGEPAGGAATIDSSTARDMGPKAVETEIVQLGAADSNAMLELAALTKPGPFEKRTHELGTYLGIRREGKLVAMTGERMKAPGFTEVSAVCTHPKHTGHGYARILIGEVMQGIFDRGEIPFLHVREDNARAIALYERLGFHTRTLLHLAIIKKT